MKRVMVAAAVWVLQACSAGSPSETERSEIPSSHIDTASLGRAYSTTRQRILNLKCVDGQVEERGNSVSQLQYEKDMSFDRILNTIGGELSVGIKFPVVSAGASAQVAKEWASQKLNETHTFHWIASPKKLVFKELSMVPSVKGQFYSDLHNEILGEKCGEEYISEIHRGASILGIVKMDFLNDEDKFHVSGKLNVDVSGGLVSVDGSLKYIDEKVKQRTKLTVTAVQNGGKPERLALIMPESLVFCNLANPEPCLQTMANLIQYAKSDFQEQLKDPAAYNVIKYVTERYDESGLDTLVPEAGYRAMDAAVKSYLEFTLETLIRKTMMDAERAFRLRTFAAETLTGDQLANVESIEKAALHNSRVLMDISRFCYDAGGVGCLDYRDSQIHLILAYNAKDLEIAPEAIDPKLTRCVAALEFALKQKWIDQDQFERYKRRRWAPVFNDLSAWEKGIQGFGPCDGTNL